MEPHPSHNRQSAYRDLDNPSLRSPQPNTRRKPPQPWKRLRKNLLWVGLLVFVWLMCSAQATAGTLTDRQQAFPNWTDKPPLQVSEGDLAYPGWLEGTWQMSSTMVDMVAPLAPDIVTPGFEGNRQFMNQPVKALIRFVPSAVVKGRFLNRPLPRTAVDEIQIVSDRAFNGLSLAQATLGKSWVKAVKVDPDNPNRQVTFLKGNQQLVSSVTGRLVEVPNAETFATSEIFQQFFRNPKAADNTPAVYLNEVENTTIYRKRADSKFPIVADQMTAIYLSPKDPDYFKAKGRPAALYRYQLAFSPVSG